MFVDFEKKNKNGNTIVGFLLKHKIVCQSSELITWLLSIQMIMWVDILGDIIVLFNFPF